MQSIDIVKDELIGRCVRIVTCTDPNMENLQGVIVDETKHMFLIESSGNQKWIAKNIASFIFPTEQKEIQIKGSKLRFRPEERVKKAR
ncbi:RNase P/RNase MRP subunit p29 [Thermoplasmatales archaeon ex4572_165]|nr:MAG: RNase P/RNase MRP subunit p29 [Thermoplasmatales archaeon ex4572_165]RLF59697.1 MAG: ribonuclease P protein subunit [Thermoplasmata archaeon]